MLDRLQATALAEDRWDHADASSVGDGFELSALMRLRSRMLDYQRGKPFFLRGASHFPFGVLMLLVEGQTKRALALANATLSALQWGAHKPMLGEFTSTFMHSMLADFLGRKFVPPQVPKLSDEAFDPQPYLQRLLAGWRTPDRQAGGTAARRLRLPYAGRLARR